MKRVVLILLMLFAIVGTASALTIVNGEDTESGSGSVGDETFNSTNFNGDTSTGVSQDDFYDRWHLFDADDDGDFTDEAWFPSTSGAPTNASYLTGSSEAGLSAENVVSANGLSLVTAADYAAMLVLLGVDDVDTEAEIEALCELQDFQGAVTDAQVPNDITITESDPNALLTAGTDNVKDTHLDWGTGANQISGADMPLVDEFTNSDATNVQDVLDDLDAAIAGGGTTLGDIVTTAPITGGTDNVLPGADADVTIAIPAATNSQNGYATSSHITAIESNTAKTSYTPAEPGEIGGTTPAAATFTTLSAGGGGFEVDSDGDVTVKSLTTSASASPGLFTEDSDCPGTDKDVGSFEWSYIDGADGSENADSLWYAFQAGVKTLLMQFDESDDQIEVKKDLNLEEDLEVATGKHITVGSNQWDDGSDLIDDDQVAFDDADSLWTATAIGPALEELNDSINAGSPNGSGAKVHWSQLTGVPAGFADGSDDGAGGAAVEDDAYTSGWDSDTTNGASQNAIYDYLHNFDADDDGSFTDETWYTAVTLADGSVPLTANWDVGAYTITALRFVSDQSTGTAPFTVASTTVVTNLNADTVDGESASEIVTAARVGGVSDNIASDGTIEWEDAGDLESDGTISANAVALGTDTTGNYVATIADSGDSCFTVANSGSETAAVTLDIADDGVDSEHYAAESIDLEHLSAGAKFQSYAVASLSDTTTPSVLTTAETTNKCISNYKSSGADHVFTMPAAHAAGNIIFQIGAEYQVDIEPNTGDLFYLNGTAMAANEHIQNTADTLGERIVGYCVNIEGTLRWMFYSSDSNWVEETPE